MSDIPAKFKDVDALVSAYASLEADYTRKCQELKRLQKANSYGFEYICREEAEPLILENEDWVESEWRTICKIFGMKDADRIKISHYKFEAFGREADNPDEEEIETVYYPGKVSYLSDPNVIETYFDPITGKTVVRRKRDKNETL